MLFKSPPERHTPVLHAECKAQISRELRYQSSLDLDEATYAAIRHLPLAKDLVRISRQQLVSHLDFYCKRHNAVFKKVRMLNAFFPFPTVLMSLLKARGYAAMCSLHFSQLYDCFCDG